MCNGTAEKNLSVIRAYCFTKLLQTLLQTYMQFIPVPVYFP